MSTEAYLRPVRSPANLPCCLTTDDLAPRDKDNFHRFWILGAYRTADVARIERLRVNTMRVSLVAFSTLVLSGLCIYQTRFETLRAVSVLTGLVSTAVFIACSAAFISPGIDVRRTALEQNDVMRGLVLVASTIDSELVEGMGPIQQERPVDWLSNPGIRPLIKVVDERFAQSPPLSARCARLEAEERDPSFLWRAGLTLGQALGWAGVR